MPHKWNPMDPHPTRSDMMPGQAELRPEARSPDDLGAAIAEALADTLAQHPAYELHTLEAKAPLRKPGGSMSRRHYLRVTLRRLPEDQP